MNIKDKILGKRISGIFNALNILLGLFCIIYYSINANRVNEFNKAVDFYLVLAIMCCGMGSILKLFPGCRKKNKTVDLDSQKKRNNILSQRRLRSAFKMRTIILNTATTEQMG